MKLAGTGPAVGLFLINEADVPLPVEAAGIMRNGPSEIEFICPNLPAGEYRLQVTTMYSGSNAVLKEARSYIFPAALKVG